MKRLVLGSALVAALGTIVLGAHSAPPPTASLGTGNNNNTIQKFDSAGSFVSDFVPVGGGLSAPPRRSSVGAGWAPRRLLRRDSSMIFKKMFGAVRAQLNKLANFFWEADPIAQMQYEYDAAVEQLKEGRVGLE